MFTFLPDDSSHTMEEALVLWVGLCLVVDELDLNGLHWTDDENGFAHAGSKASQETLCLLQVTLLIGHSVLQELKHREPRGERRGRIPT